MSRPFLKVNGIELPCPRDGLQFLGEQIVDSARNANGIVVSQLINRRQVKFEPLYWGKLDPPVWEMILEQIEKFYATAEFYYAPMKSFVRMEMYWGNYSATPKFVVDGKPTFYMDCTCNLIDIGKPIITI